MPSSSASDIPASAKTSATSGRMRSDDALPACSRRASAVRPSKTATDSHSVEVSSASIRIACILPIPCRTRGVKSAPFTMIELTIESRDQEGRGIAHSEGKVVFVEGGLPGERVAAEVVKRKPSYEIARAVRVE